jgi:zinc/manganese transport system permease protein
VRMLVVYAVLGAVHVAFRKRFLLLSTDPEGARAQGVRVVAWDFLFYLTFGLVITQSVRIAGVLLVFSYLIVPAACAALLLDRMVPRLVLGWALGFLGSVAGLYASARLDLPTGAAIVAAFGAIMACVLIVRAARRGPRRAAAG